ncbi:hypothetical protein CLAFUW4_13603 [Fulvia fulva]|uniref:Uncharacterized protein n=1 Tax=Passalora fulva TaxID=5499 RepID=A0A9Q8UW50_PASFU|nr:uncharacterized protein CLAFUR5_13455 [Fulvia fulva]KAK4610594.1 hypothetical protein CLAFUR4_13606 [Fulvia fulva]KAK4611252.1 hypothetical protein CLAFUR0_13611 [Fulvia fulva]UJO24638.1 hypothetical protein CLAFUR5_13455 [Fulvia fulva]WPV22278.1 hypothetical protein CLAFUW4_13603 [Fulvia fulva]WPV36702.1 hypothetical protein CLAFUW7_13611 [Fulvia fulva]
MAPQNDVEMQYQASEQMSQQSDATGSSEEQCSQNKTEEKAKRTLLGMRGGGIILDLCACFICCECM